MFCLKYTQVGCRHEERTAVVTVIRLNQALHLARRAHRFFPTIAPRARHMSWLIGVMKFVCHTVFWRAFATGLLTCVLVVHASPQEPSNVEVHMIKSRIISLAQSFAGQGDPDYSKQKAFEPLIEELLRANPLPPLKERLPMLFGAWKQVWGPYDYSGNKRGVNPEIGVEEIYQVVFPGGYYYNVTPLYKSGDRARERIALLRGEFKLDPTQADVLLVRFTRYPGLGSRPRAPELWELPAVVGEGKLKSDISIVPTWIVRLFFGGGALKEVYTDADLRILYGAGNNKFKDPALYIMTRAK